MSRASATWQYSAYDAWARYVMTTVQFPHGLLPNVHVRPGIAAVSVLLLAAMAVLGFHPTMGSHFPVHSDKALHFFAFGSATFLLYWVLEVPDEALRRRNWFWRHFAAVTTGSTCMSAGIVSEFVQAALPYKTFQIGDIAANLLGTACGLYGSTRLDRHQRQRVEEVAHLYLPADDDDDDDDDESDQQVGIRV